MTTARRTMYAPLDRCPNSVDDARRYREGTAGMLRERQFSASRGVGILMDDLAILRRVAYTRAEELDDLDLDHPHTRLVIIRACKIANDLCTRRQIKRAAKSELMPIELFLQAPPRPPTRRASRVAAQLRRGAWLIFGLSALAFFTMYGFGVMFGGRK